MKKLGFEFLIWESIDETDQPVEDMVFIVRGVEAVEEEVKRTENDYEFLCISGKKFKSGI